MPPDQNDDVYGIEGAHGTIAPQVDEGYLDDRSDADDDMEKGRIHFPAHIYGRERELEALGNVYDELASVGGRNGECGCSDLGDDNVGIESVQPARADGAYDGSRVVFLSGYSGVGKSALVKEFVRRTRRKHELPIYHASGKYTEQRSATTPFSAIGEALAGLATCLSNMPDEIANHELLSIVRGRIKHSELVGPGTDGNHILRGTFPGLAPFLDGCDDMRQQTKAGDGSRNTPAAHPSMNAIKECTREMLSLISNALEHPLIIFLDDLQWSDEASIDMLTFLLSSHGLRNVMFICAYRSNEVGDDHPFATLMNKAEKARSSDEEGTCNLETVKSMDLFSLPPESIARFIADCVKKDEADEVADLAEVVYQKTMGNIFFVRQALEELVRKNILFYDLMCFEWRWVASKAELSNYMSDDVVDTVKGKIRELSADLQRLLMVMAYIPNTLDAAMLVDLMEDGQLAFEQDAVRDLLKEASDEGMLILSVESGNYVLAHDRIRQALIELAADKNQEELLRHISAVLLSRAQGPEMEWCLFVAVDLLDSLPPSKTDHVGLAKLNLRVATIARSRGSSLKEHQLLLKGLECLESSGLLWKDYVLTYDLYRGVIASEYSLGSYDEARIAINQVLKNAKTMDDKLVAYLHQMLCSCDESRDYPQTVDDGIKILGLYGYKIPSTPTKACMAKEEMKMKVALRGRSYSCLADLPVVEVPILMLFNHIAKYALFSSKDRTLRILAYRAIECSLKNGIDPNFPRILALFGGSLAKEGKVKPANEIGNVALALSDKIRDDKENYALCRMAVYTTTFCQLQPFRNAIDCLHECYKDLKLVGSVEVALGSMLVYSQAYFAAGLELGPLLESKLYLVEQYCRDVERMSFLMTFQICRQFALNLRKRMEKPTVLEGEAFHEGEILAAMTIGPGRASILRDSSSHRLQLAFIFWDEDTIVDMLNLLESYPLTDNMVARLHNRLCFIGLAAFALPKSRASQSIWKLGQNCLSYFEHLAKNGSVNARPVFLFMQALKSPGREAFAAAIDACVEAKFVHLQAMALERYAAFLRMENDASLADKCIASAYWRYRDWGADAKALVLSQQHEFLEHCKRKDAKSLTLSTSGHSSKASSKIVYSFNSTFKSSRKRVVHR